MEQQKVAGQMFNRHGRQHFSHWLRTTPQADPFITPKALVIEMVGA